MKKYLLTFLFFLPFVALADANNNITSFWKFDESSGNAADSVGANTLTNNGTATFVSGLINNAGSLGTSNSTKSFSRTSFVNAFQSNFTYNLWVKINTVPTNNGNAYELVSDTDNTTANHKGQAGIQYDQEAGVTKLYINRADSAGNDQYGASVALGTGTWHMITFTWDGANINGYIDGSCSASVTGASTRTGTNTGTGIGTSYFDIGKEDSNAGRSSSSDHDATGVWTRALTCAEIQSLYNGGAGQQYPFPSTSFNFYQFLDF